MMPGTMSGSTCVRCFAHLKALKEQQRTNEKPTSPGMDSAVEVERKEDPSSSVGDVEGPS